MKKLLLAFVMAAALSAAGAGSALALGPDSRACSANPEAAGNLQIVFGFDPCHSHP